MPRSRKPDDRDPRRSLPSVDELLRHDAVRPLLTLHARVVVTEALQEALAALRRELRAGDAAPDAAAVSARAAAWLADYERERLRPVVNATGILLHTGLGRAVLPQPAVDALAGLHRCCNLQIDLATGLRGRRTFMTERLLCRLTGAEAAMVVNNNAAATLLILTALCKGREVIVSRGQLIEIGGSYRLPDCVHQSGATLVEVGTTNKTHLRDYEAALTENTGALLRVNQSNYRIVGFAQDVSTAELASLKKGRDGLLLIDDLGCGALVDLQAYGLPHEPMAQDSIRAGADLVCFSGDKLIGGPQAGIIVGRQDLVQKIRKHPLTRMLRVGKMTDMALEHTLRLFLEPASLAERNPTLRMLAAGTAALSARAQTVAEAMGPVPNGWSVEVAETESSMGGGSLPGHAIPSVGIAVRSTVRSLEDLLRRLREHEPPVIARIHEDRVVLDMRTVLDGEERIVAGALAALWKE